MAHTLMAVLQHAFVPFRVQHTRATLESDLLGASQVTEALEVAQQRIEGLTLEWIEVHDGSSLADRSIGDGELRTRTGASVVAVIRGSSSEPAPGPDFVLRPGDVVVAVGTAEGLELLRQALRT